MTTKADRAARRALAKSLKTFFDRWFGGELTCGAQHWPDASVKMLEWIVVCMDAIGSGPRGSIPFKAAISDGDEGLAALAHALGTLHRAVSAIRWSGPSFLTPEDLHTLTICGADGRHVPLRSADGRRLIRVALSILADPENRIDEQGPGNPGDVIGQRNYEAIVRDARKARPAGNLRKRDLLDVALAAGHTTGDFERWHKAAVKRGDSPTKR